MPNYTTEDMIRYVYKETTVEETMAIEKALQTDWDLKEKLMLLQDSMQRLDDMVESPRPQSVMAILNYARTSSAMEIR